MNITKLLIYTGGASGGVRAPVPPNPLLHLMQWNGKKQGKEKQRITKTQKGR